MRGWFAAWLRALVFRSAADREVTDEIDSALAILEARERDAGASPAEARRRARAAFGSVAAAREGVDDVRPGAALGAFLLDARYAVRGLRKTPGLSAVIIVTLALGIGANAAIFSILHTLLLSPLPYRDANRLVFVWSDMTNEGYPRAPLSGPELADLRQRSTTVAAFGAIWANTIALTGEGDPEQLRIGLVTDNFFDVLGAPAALGRTFTPPDALPGAHPSILLSWGVFARRYGGDPSIVGRQILVNDRPVTVIGVMPAAFRLLLPPDSSVPDDLQAWTPFSSTIGSGPRGQQYLRVVGRMRPGVTVAAARADIDAVARRISREFPEYGTAGRIFNTVGLQQDDVREVRPALLALFGGIGILLVIACVNVASLLIARALARTKETALRLALGATRGRLLRQCLTEGFVLAALGGAGGLAAGYAVLEALVSLRPVTLSRIDLAHFDPTVVLFTFGVSLAWGMLFSLAPMVEILRTDLAIALQRSGRGAGLPLRSAARAVLVSMQVALSVVLLIAATLLLRGFIRLQHVDPGFRADHALTFRLAVPFQRYRPPDGFTTFSRQLRQSLAAIPGVTAVGAMSHLPYDDLPNWGGGYQIPTAPADGEGPIADYRTVTPGLFQALGIHVLEGRAFTESDGRANPVAIVDDRLAARLWPGHSPLNQTILVDPGSSGTPHTPVTIVGVVPHLRLRSLVADMGDQVILPQAMVLRNPMAYVVHADRDPAALTADVRKAIAALDPKLPIYDIRPLHDYIINARAMRRFTMELALAFALVAVLLACVGVYGVLAYSTMRRRHEFGVRLALGAEPRRIAAAVLKESLTMSAAGVAIGTITAVAVSGGLASQLDGIPPHDLVSYAGPIVLLSGATLLASAWPARRAMRGSPMDALRTD